MEPHEAFRLLGRRLEAEARKPEIDQAVTAVREWLQTAEPKTEIEKALGQPQKYPYVVKRWLRPGLDPAPNGDVRFSVCLVACCESWPLAGWPKVGCRGVEVRWSDSAHGSFFLDQADLDALAAVIKQNGDQVNMGQCRLLEPGDEFRASYHETAARLAIEVFATRGSGSDYWELSRARLLHRERQLFEVSGQFVWRGLETIIEKANKALTDLLDQPKPTP